MSNVAPTINRRTLTKMQRMMSVIENARKHLLKDGEVIAHVPTPRDLILAAIQADVSDLTEAEKLAIEVLLARVEGRQPDAGLVAGMVDAVVGGD